MVNSGRLSMPSTYETPLSTPDEDAWSGSARLGAPLPDAPMLSRNGQPIWLLEALGGEETLIHVPNGAAAPVGKRVLVIGHDLVDAEGLFAQRFDTTPGSTYLVRPDQHLAARWRHATPSLVECASRRLRGFEGGHA
jgi:3-(3-hydroxy-phenyl)propionate hydroxylase